jgi:hypothetical protein
MKIQEDIGIRPVGITEQIESQILSALEMRQDIKKTLINN